MEPRETEQRSFSLREFQMKFTPREEALLKPSIEHGTGRLRMKKSA
jgi:hypothetical protein